MQYSITEFEALYIRCFPPSLRLAVGLLHDEDDARDTVQEVFVKLWESDFKIANPEGFIVRAVRNACINRINTADTRTKIINQLALERMDAADEREDRDEDVRTAIVQLLSQRERQVVDKLYSEGLSYKDAAKSLNVSVATINKNAVSALRKLRTHFKKNANHD